MKEASLKAVCIGFILVLSVIPGVYAQKISDEVAQRIILSEGADQGLKGMICIGEVLRHRESLAGFYGYNSNWINKEPKSVWEMAAKAWKESAHTNYTKGADHFENIHRFGTPWWVKYCVKTYEHKNHVFYREVRRR
jgi:hypothetical protein